MFGARWWTCPNQEGKWTNRKKPLLIHTVESSKAGIMEVAEGGKGGTGLQTTLTWSKSVLTPWRAEHTVCRVGWLPSPFRAGGQQPPPEKRGMCCNCYLGGTSVISVLQAQALAGHRSHPDIQLVPSSAGGGLQPTGPAVATCEAACQVQDSIPRIRCHLSVYVGAG